MPPSTVALGTETSFSCCSSRRNFRLNDLIVLGQKGWLTCYIVQIPRRGSYSCIICILPSCSYSLTWVEIFPCSSVWGAQLWWFKEMCSLPVSQCRSSSWEMVWKGWGRQKILTFFLAHWFKFLAIWWAADWLSQGWSLAFCIEVAAIWGGLKLLKCP